VGVSYRIAQAKGAHAKAVQVSYTADWLVAHGRIDVDGTLTLPVFGLYANRKNDVEVTFTFVDGSTQKLPIRISTTPYTDPRGIYDHPELVQPLDPDVALGYSYVYIKASRGTPMIIDTDAQIRWVGTGIDNSFSSNFLDNGFTIGSHDFPTVYRLELDGTWTSSQIASPSIEHFQHNIAAGREARLGGVDTMTAGVENIQSTVIEFDDAGDVLRTWDFAQIIGDYMRAQGDDADAFVRPGANWLHINSQIYDPSDDTLIVSSREQFVIKIRYDSREIVWILGDPTKYWYTFPSLRAKALALSPKDAYVPIGQHSINITADGDLLLFNNGMRTSPLAVPHGAPLGQKREFSAVNAYRINAKKMKAAETRRYTHDETMLSRVCSSAAESLLADGGSTMLVDFAAAENDTRMHLVGLGADGRMAFEYVYGTNDCSTGWNAQPIAFDALAFQ
jgi:arylsulfate sulfotransferase